MKDALPKAEADSGSDLLLPSAAARIAGVSSATIRNWIYQGRLPAVALSGGWRAIRRRDIERLVEQRA
jgi:excisionase family DNA binding protein